MNLICNVPVISICIPTYNGFSYITSLIDELLSSRRTDLEVVISDDYSDDGTWDFILNRSKIDPRLKCFRNEKNLGMDENFSKTVSLASGLYVWLCGQDDIIHHEGIDAVIDHISSNPGTDFIFMNHIKVSEEQLGEKFVPIKSDSFESGVGLETFLDFHKNELPTFLPKFVIRKSLWDSVDISQYYTTSYCQVGVFLEVSRIFSWSHLNGCYVVGLTPNNGWQVDPSKFSRISLGFFAMLYRASEKCDWLGKKIIEDQLSRNFPRLLLSVVLIKTHNIEVDQKLILEAINISKWVKFKYWLLRCILDSPSFVSKVLLSVISCRRKIRKTIWQKSYEGPHFD